VDRIKIVNSISVPVTSDKAERREVPPIFLDKGYAPKNDNGLR